jgi:acyl transferase domain-containing protein/acyl carrier protein
VNCQRLASTQAFHSAQMAGLVAPFAAAVAQVARQPPQLPLVSSMRGRWLTAAEATDPHYWAAQLRAPVRFADGLAQLHANGAYTYLEVGPGRQLSGLVRQTLGEAAISSGGTAPPDEGAGLWQALGQLWLRGQRLDWAALYAGQPRRRVPLPTYPFERQRYWIDPPAPAAPPATPGRGVLSSAADIADWFYIPAWKRTLPAPARSPEALCAQRRRWLILSDESSLATHFIERLVDEEQTVIQVRAGTSFRRIEPKRYTIDASARTDYVALLRDLYEQELVPDIVVHLWSMTCEQPPVSNLSTFHQAQQMGFSSLLWLLQAADQHQAGTPLQIWVLSNHLFEIASTDTVQPEKASLLGPCLIIPQEHEHIRCHCIDLGTNQDDPAHIQRLVAALLDEIETESPDMLLAYRNHQRWVRAFEPARLTDHLRPIRALREHGVYLLTGGLGNIGLLLAEDLARTIQARLVLTSSTPFPARDIWAGWLAEHEQDDRTSQIIRRLQQLEALGAQVLVASADVADITQMRAVIDRARQHFGALQGVFHLAGWAGIKSARLARSSEPSYVETHFQPKVYGLYVLEQLLQGQPVDFCVLFSSNAALLGGVGLTSYAAANLFMDAFAIDRNRRGGTSWLSVNWDSWDAQPGVQQRLALPADSEQHTIRAEEGIAALRRVIALAGADQIVVSKSDLNARFEHWVDAGAAGNHQSPAISQPQARPDLGTAYVPANNALEQALAHIWQEALGLDSIGIHDNFFDLGGNSLIGLKIIGRLQDELHIDMPVVSLFEGPTISTFARLLDQAPRDTSAQNRSRSRGEQRREARQHRYE